MWNLPPPPGFLGLRPDVPLHVYLRNLPHWRQDGATYFVTFRLADSLPETKLDELDALRAEWLKRHPPPHATPALEALARQQHDRIERWLDQGMGACWLQSRAHADLLTSALHHFDGDRYELACYTVMPNHAHVIVRPLKPCEYPLEDIAGSWKKHSARRINAAIHRTGHLWHEESYDRIVRDEEHLWRVIQYIGANAARAGIVRQHCPTWIKPAWVGFGWRFEDPM